MGNSVGTLSKVVIDGMTFDVFPDSKVSYNPSDFEIEAQVTTGDALFKMTKRIPAMEGLELACTLNQLEILKEKSNSVADITLAVEFADASIYRSSGRIKTDNWESDTGKISVDLLPKRGWTAFLA